ncbi:MAG: hypothetical protein J6Y02_05935 [Pseudobutyrivibrio sp.]|nr:hypothetical protein [Pseudobutyrivibrio sp.]
MRHLPSIVASTLWSTL